MIDSCLTARDQFFQLYIITRNWFTNNKSDWLIWYWGGSVDGRFDCNDWKDG
jgi:hypothetical protein